MKDAKQFLADLQEDKDLAQAFEALGPTIEEAVSKAKDPEVASIEAVTAFAAEHGYQFEAEELALQTATNREVTDEDLAAIAGGTKGPCNLDYWCNFVWNTCVYSNECERTHECQAKVHKEGCAHQVQ
ncbi:MAG: Nif11-like leader peptide family RiPP precursor [Coriobacteriia bacterium]|nr:Nif11-like leader peptide family RiPP precursor [Coriobacteriia bacterium]